MPYRKLAYLPDRRSSRVEKSIAVYVSGFDDAHKPYHEKVLTVSISCHGCRYRSQHRVGVGDMTILEFASPHAGAVKRSALARVRSLRQVPENPGLFDVAVELALPRNIWALAFPPEDWGEFEAADGHSTSKPLSGEMFPAPEARPAEGLGPEEPSIPSELTSRVSGDRRVGTSPPAVAQIALKSWEPIKPAAMTEVRPATARNSKEALDDVCSKLQNKASQILEDLVAELAKELSKQSEQSGHITSLEALEHSIAGFEQAAPTSARRSA